MGAQAPRMGRSEYGILLGLGAVWGGSFFFGKFAGRELPPITIALCRVGLAALILNLVLGATGRRLPRQPRLWGQFLILGLLNNALPFSLIFWGQTRITSGLASILNATTPAWGAVLTHLLTRDEKLTANKAVGVALGLCGAITLIGWEFLLGHRGSLPAQLAVLCASLSYASAGIWGKRFRGMDPVLLTTVQSTCAALLLLPVALLTFPTGKPFAPSLAVVGALLTLAIPCTAVAYGYYFRLLASSGASSVFLVTFLVPVSANALGALFLGETIGLQQVVGMLLIGLGLVVIDGRLLARRMRPAEE